MIYFNVVPHLPMWGIPMKPSWAQGISPLCCPLLSDPTFITFVCSWSGFHFRKIFDCVEIHFLLSIRMLSKI